MFVSLCQLPTYIRDSFLLIFETWHYFLHQGNKIRPLIAICFSDVLGGLNGECSTFAFLLANVMIQGPEPSLSEAIGSLLVCITIQKYSQCTSNRQVFESFSVKPSHFGSSGFPMPTDTWLIGIVIFQPLSGATLERSCKTILFGCSYIAFCQEDMGTERGLPSRQSSHEKEQRETPEMAGESDADSDWQVCELPD